jgi:hypothetical protein
MQQGKTVDLRVRRKGDLIELKVRF